MSEDKITQTNNRVEGDLAGRDIHHHHNYGSVPVSALRDLSRRLKLDGDKTYEHKGLIEKLQHYSRVTDATPTRDLETKLRAAKREHMLQQALQLKERFAKKLVEHQFSEKAQEIYAHILSEMVTFFMLEVTPKVHEGMRPAEIDHLIYEGLLRKLYDQVGTSELNIDLSDLNGMIYFLAGNCHVAWD